MYLDGRYDECGPIGGPGHVIEVDGMKLGRRKYERGRVVEDSWILRMVDIETNDCGWKSAQTIKEIKKRC